MSLKYAVIGTGAIGGYYGGKLAQSGKEVHFLFHSDYEYVKKKGLQVDSITGNFHLYPISAYNKTTDMPVCDVVLVGLKTTNNSLLKELLHPIIHQNTLVILIQNGLGLEENLQKDFPELKIAGGLAFICSNKVGEGHINHLDYGKINLGAYSCSEEQLLAVCADFIQAGIEAEVIELNLARWKKLVWNIPYNGMSVVLNTTTDKLMNNPSSRQLLYDLMIEVIRAGNAVGNSIPDSFADEMLEMTETMKPYAPSMKLDYNAKRPLEIDAIYSSPIRKALKAGYVMQKVSMLERQLQFIQEQY